MKVIINKLDYIIDIWKHCYPFKLINHPIWNVFDTIDELKRINSNLEKFRLTFVLFDHGLELRNKYREIINSRNYDPVLNYHLSKETTVKSIKNGIILQLPISKMFDDKRFIDKRIMKVIIEEKSLNIETNENCIWFEIARIICFNKKDFKYEMLINSERIKSGEFLANISKILTRYPEEMANYGRNKI